MGFGFGKIFTTELTDNRFFFDNLCTEGTFDHTLSL
jgi:hypothetical protein